MLSWQPGENLLYRPEPVAPRSPFELERVRQVNLEYLSKMPNFVADETARRYWSDSAEKPWRLYDTVEDEITFTGPQLDHQNIRRNGKPFHRPFGQLGRTVWGGVGFGAELRALFDLKCPTKIDFGGTDMAGGAELLVYLFRSPAEGCFVSVQTPWTAGTTIPPGRPLSGQRRSRKRGSISGRSSRLSSEFRVGA